MTELVYPERKRCRTCRKYFGFEVINGKFCSRECAGLPPLPLPPNPVPVPFNEEWGSMPRSCRNSPKRGGRPKARWPDEQSAKMIAGKFSRQRPVNVYQCEHCNFWHIGHGGNNDSAD